jgi:hypothetical protein
MSPSLRVLPNVVTPQSVRELVDTIEAVSGVHLWRGQGDISWPLDSSMVRRLRKVSGPRRVSEREVAREEQRLLKRARHLGFDRESGFALSDFELLARLRHHGAATRLIDFTRSAAVGLWFAAASEPSRSGVLLGVHTDYLSGHEGVPIDHDYPNELARLVAWNAKAGEPRIRTWQPGAVSPRTAAQHSQISFSIVGQFTHGTMPLPTSQVDGCQVIEILPEIKPPALEFLRGTLDIGWSTLFPDLDGFAVAWSVNAPEDVDRW